VEILLGREPDDLETVPWLPCLIATRPDQDVEVGLQLFPETETSRREIAVALPAELHLQRLPVLGGPREPEVDMPVSSREHLRIVYATQNLRHAPFRTEREKPRLFRIDAPVR